MIKIRLTEKGNSRVLSEDKGILLSAVLADHTSFDHPCGGAGKCLACRIKARGHLSPPGPVERDALGAEKLAQGWRLACLTRALGDVELELGDKGLGQIQSQAVLPDFAYDPLYRHHGVAVDIGTTTLCAQLFAGPEMVAEVSRKNPQTAFGADVISRIDASLKGRGEELAAAIGGALREMTHELCEQHSIVQSQVEVLVITGNTTMLYLLTGRSPASLSAAPFQADHSFGEFLPAYAFPGRLGLSPEAKIYLPRCISAFVGADITTAILASGMTAQEETTLLVDIGTNGEMGLWHGGQLFVCSTAAGPAFEGVGLACGTYGLPGAIDRVWVEGEEIHFSTIGGQEALGLCGSGVVAAVAALLATEQIEESGYMEAEQYAFSDDVFISAEDVRKVQLAKAAIRAGMETLLAEASLSWDEVSRLYLAGGFGSFLNLESAAAIGLLPPSVIPRTQVLDNAALGGATMILRNQAFMEETTKLAQSAHSLSLDTSPVFMESYVEQMMFAEEV